MQLLAAWLVGLIAIDTAFLTIATQLEAGSLERWALVCAAIANVPIFLIAFLVLQTRFRPELQEDSYYSQYLDRRTNTVVTVARSDAIENELNAIRHDLRVLVAEVPQAGEDGKVSASWKWKVGLNSRLADFADLRQALKKAAIPLTDVFGTTEPPDERVVAIALHVDFASIIRVLRLALDWNMDGYVYFDPREEHTEEDFLIGAYGRAEHPLLPELLTVLEQDPEPIDLQLYERKHQREPSDS